MSTLLISAAAVKARSRIASSLDDDIIRPTIEIAQTNHLLPILGGGLYDYLIANQASLNAAHTTLLQTWIWPALVQYTLLEGMVDWQYRIEGSGQQVRRSENATSASQGEIHQLRDHIRQRADLAARRLIEHICDNRSSYPTYATEGANHPGVIPQTIGDFTGSTIEVARRNKKRELKRWQYDKRR
jgi:hypothetical protein